MIKALLSEPEQIVQLIKKISPNSEIVIDGDVITVKYKINYIIIWYDRCSGTDAVIHSSFLPNPKDALREYLGSDMPIKTGEGEWYEIKQVDNNTNRFYLPEFQNFA